MKMKTTYLLPFAFLVVLIGCNKKSIKAEEVENTTTLPNTKPLTHSTMKGFNTDIERDVMENTNYRKVLYTGQHMQLVLMTLKPGEEIGEEVHAKSDQFFRFESGVGKCVVDGNEYMVEAGDVVLVPSGAKHNVVNTDATTDLKLYTIYALPNHKDGIVRTTKKDAELHEAPFDGTTTEKE
jgi:mannose-6-phosphate isomerase-like protein (cupin superfamily)